MPVWAIPWIVAAGLGVIGAGGTLWYRDQYHQCQLAVASDVAKAEERQRVLREADEKFTSRLEEQAKTIKDALNDQSHATTVALAKAKSDPNCLRTDAARAFDSGVVPKPADQTGTSPKVPPRK